MMRSSIVHAGLVSSVGLSAPATCAAIRGALTNHTQTRFMNARASGFSAHRSLWRSLARTGETGTECWPLAIEECLTSIGDIERHQTPFLLCLAEGSVLAVPRNRRPPAARVVTTRLDSISTHTSRLFFAGARGSCVRAG